jgi:tRNA(Ile)-lysidine synthase TilS/MesJ
VHFNIKKSVAEISEEYEMNRCRKCNLPEGKLNVVINDNGICNYCEYLEQNRQDVMDFTGREQILLNRLEKFTGKYRYDAVVGLSGGKDSTYVLLQMVKKYNLQVAAVTFDNGFLTDFAKESINNTVRVLGVDHYYYKPDWKIHRKFYKLAIQKMGNPCTACSLAGYFLAIKECSANQIPFFIHGRTPYQMYRNYYKGSNDVFLNISRLNLEEHSFTRLSQVYGMINNYVKQLITRMVSDDIDAKAITEEFFVDSNKLTNQFTPEFLAYFLFEEYDEERIKKQLEEALGWQRHSSDNLLTHHDCDIHDAAMYMFRELNDVDKLEREVAVMVRLGQISREKAGELMRINELKTPELEKSLDSLCTLCEFNREELNNCLATLKQAGGSKFESVL